VTGPLVLKLGGELVETTAGRERLAALAASVAAGRPLVVVHGGGRAIDAELARRRIGPRKVDGLRVTDAATLEAVVAVLAGSTNTDVVAALVGRGLRAVGLTGVDAGFGRAARVGAHRMTTGATADLGLVGDPVAPDPALLTLLLAHGYVPIVASLGIELADDGAETAQVLNVNADVMACRIAAALPGSHLVLAGATAGVLDPAGRTLPELDVAGIDRVIADGTATAGMIAKLSACREAFAHGVASARIVDGRAFGVAASIDALPGTTLYPARAFSTTDAG
jgi:acetylglutamate kinase